MEGKT